MNLRRANLQDLKEILTIVHDTVNRVYPNYYLPEVVDFFINYHSEENIKADIEKGTVYLILDNDCIVGTGTDGRPIHRSCICTARAPW